MLQCQGKPQSQVRPCCSRSPRTVRVDTCAANKPQDCTVLKGWQDKMFLFSNVSGMRPSRSSRVQLGPQEDLTDSIDSILV
ncbi:hypothetical protein TNCV_2713221 [Trichonephila clavipes]|nr:hypothetical protein TNCV_2713221 [Trichonephila clavipes]